MVAANSCRFNECAVLRMGFPHDEKTGETRFGVLLILYLPHRAMTIGGRGGGRPWGRFLSCGHHVRQNSLGRLETAMNDTKRLVDEIVGQEVMIIFRSGFVPEKRIGRLEACDHQFVKLNLGKEGRRKGICLISISAIHWIAPRG